MVAHDLDSAHVVSAKAHQLLDKFAVKGQTDVDVFGAGVQNVSAHIHPHMSLVDGEGSALLEGGDEERSRNWCAIGKLAVLANPEVADVEMP